MKLDKQKIISEAPEGATHYSANSSTYYFGNARGLSEFISLEDLRAMPDDLFYAAFNFESYDEYLRCTPPGKQRLYMSEYEKARRTLKLDVGDEQVDLTAPAIEGIDSTHPRPKPDGTEAVCPGAPKGATHYDIATGTYYAETTSRWIGRLGTIKGIMPLPRTEPVKRSKYHREIKPGVWVDFYDIVNAWSVTNPALQHLIKKALQPGERGHKDLLTDMQDIVDSAVRARQIEVERVR